MCIFLDFFSMAYYPEIVLFDSVFLKLLRLATSKWQKKQGLPLCVKIINTLKSNI